MAGTYSRDVNGCTVTHTEGDHRTWIFFDPRVSCVEKGAAGEHFEKIARIAGLTRINSGRKYTFNLQNLDDGVIEVTNNIAIEGNFNIDDEIIRVCNIIASARV